MSATDDIKKRVMTPILPKTKPMTPPSAPAGEDVVEQSREEYLNSSASRPKDESKADAYNQPKEEKPTAMETDLNKIEVSKVEAPTPVLDNYERMAQLTDPNRPLSTYEQEQLDKKHKREAIFSALGDGISSLANVYFSTQGAYDMLPDPSESLSAKSKARWDKIKADRDAKDLRFYENVQRRQAERRKLEAASKLSPYEQAMMDWRMRNAESKDNYLMSETQRKAEADKERLRQSSLLNAAKVKYYESRPTSRSSSSQTKYTPITISSNEVIDIPSHMFDDVIMDLWSLIPEADQKIVGTKDIYGNYKPATKLQIENEVYKRVRNDVSMQELLRFIAERNKPTAKKETQEKKPNPIGTSSKKTNPMS
jgi:hypothetical protein